MTWTARATVQDVSDGPRPIDVLAVANADETYTSHRLVRYEGQAGVYEDVELACLVSNTEGRIRSIEITLVLDEDSTTLKPGDVIQLSGSFTG